MEENDEKLTEMVHQIQKGARSTDQARNRMSKQQMMDNIDQKAETMMNKYETVVVEAMKILQEQAGPETLPKQTSKAVEKPKSKFHPQASLKPQSLEREASYAEFKHFCECLEAFLMDGYSGEIPQQAIK